MEALRTELRRLGRAHARAVGGRRGARLHVLVLVGAFAAACVHRLGLPLPGLSGLEGRWDLTLIVAACLLLIGPLLARLLARVARPRPLALARRLDDRFAWHDDTSTALALGATAKDRPVGALLVAQAAGRLRELDALRFAPVGRLRRWPRLGMVLLFVFVLLAPGVGGLFGAVGREGLEREARGGAEDVELLSPPRPMRADFWLQHFVENPLPVEPLPEAFDPAGKGPR